LPHCIANTVQIHLDRWNERSEKQDEGETIPSAYGVLAASNPAHFAA
jgi:hypothetical protein